MDTISYIQIFINSFKVVKIIFRNININIIITNININIYK